MSQRRPRDLEGLLKFCREITASEDAPSTSCANTLDPERREFLENVLKDLSVDVIKEFTEAIKILIDPKINDENATNFESQLYAMDCIEDWVGKIDMAINFHKVGGFECLLGLLLCPHAILRQQAAHLIAELTQNNPYCQEQMVKDEFLKILLEMLDKSSENDQVRVKALYAVSCITRECPHAHEAWEKLDGVSIVLRAMQSNIVKLKTKSCFLLAALCEEDPRFKEILISRGIVLQLSALLVATPRDESHEQIARLLNMLVQSNPIAVREAAENKNLKSTLVSRLDTLEERYEEERDYYRQILKTCFSNQEPLVER